MRYPAYFRDLDDRLLKFRKFVSSHEVSHCGHNLL